MKDYKKMNRQMANPLCNKLFNNRNTRLRHGVGRR